MEGPFLPSQIVPFPEDLGIDGQMQYQIGAVPSLFHVPKHLDVREEIANGTS